MAATLAHRGPDDVGVFVDLVASIALGHRRLSIIDLSAEGHQPMVSACGRYVIVYNGEIYNFGSLRVDLEKLGHGFRGASDTEVMLEIISRWGLENALARFNGMFAFAVWDQATRTLHLARDRLGEKPLYYGWFGRTFIFGSELKALRAHPGFHGTINRDALALYLRHNCVPGPYSIFHGVSKLPPGTRLAVTQDSYRDPPAPARYWSAKTVAKQAAGVRTRRPERETLRVLDELLRDAVKLRMEADVPLGAFLSGGIDSSTIVALMQAQSSRPVRTFSVGYEVDGYNEAIYAKQVARHLGSEHTELYVTPREAIEVIPDLPRIYDEPFSDSSQIPTFLISRVAKRHVTVCISGDGGDELFGGYNRYSWGRNLWRGIHWIPLGIRWAMGRFVTGISPQSWDALLGPAQRLLPKRYRQPCVGDRLHKLSEVFTVVTPQAMYHRLVSHWKAPACVVLGGTEPLTLLTDRLAWTHFDDVTEQMMYLDTVTYLPDDILTKVDRASMAVGLETRVPFLDHRLFEFVWTLPLPFRIRGGQGKWLLRRILEQYLPRRLFDRPKMGFGVPIDHWLRGPLREWAEGLLAETRLRNEGFFDPTPIRETWAEHVSGRRNWQYLLWDILMFQAWLQHWAA